MELMMDIWALKTKYEISNEDLNLIREYGDIIKPRLDEYVTIFYSWMTFWMSTTFFSKMNVVWKRCKTYKSIIGTNLKCGYRRGICGIQATGWLSACQYWFRFTSLLRWNEQEPDNIGAGPLRWQSFR